MKADVMVKSLLLLVALGISCPAQTQWVDCGEKIEALRYAELGQGDDLCGLISWYVIAQRRPWFADLRCLVMVSMALAG